MKKLLILILLIAYPLSSLGEDAIDPVGSGSTTTGPGSDDDLFMFDDMDEFIVADPLEPINRGIFWFNDKLYFYLMKPVARGYRRVIPESMRVSVQHFFNNLATPVRLINSGLQFRFRDAGNELLRFAVNTSLGIGGFFDPAKEHFNIRGKDEDTGQTLGHYGFGPGFYLVLPVLGPSNLRDGIGLLADSRMDLTSYAWEENQDYLGVKVLDAINELSLDKDTYEGIKQDALDPYLFVRDAYIQYRQNKVRN
jgi:phospholipid-binding lipoprotein MlaA